MVQPPAEPDDRPLATFSPPNEAAPGRKIEIRTPVARIGQGPQNEIVLDDDTVSTHHARLEFSDGGWRLIDLESRNGTYVDGVRLAPGIPTPLPDIAAVAFGAVKLGFRSEDGTDLAQAVAEYRPPTERPTRTRRAGFRLPVWLMVMVLFFVALLVFLFLWFGGEPTAVPAPDGQPVSLSLASMWIGEIAPPPIAA